MVQHALLSDALERLDVSFFLWTTPFLGNMESLFEESPRHSMGLPYMPISWGGFGGQCRYIWHTWSVWVIRQPPPGPPKGCLIVAP